MSGTNIYRHQFISSCPNNSQSVIYQLEIQSANMIQVEHIVTACRLLQKGYHEMIADELYARFGGFQIIKAYHHGVDVETQRGSS